VGSGHLPQFSTDVSENKTFRGRARAGAGDLADKFVTMPLDPCGDRRGPDVPAVKSGEHLSGTDLPDPGAAIRTPDQRLRVFVSSTLEELADEREAARNAIARLRLTPVMFESAARPHPPRQLYRAYVEQSEVFIGIYWQRYGWVAPGMAASGLEEEYVLSAGKPRLIYIKAPAPEREQRLEALPQRIRADQTASYKNFSTPAGQGELIANARQPTRKAVPPAQARRGPGAICRSRAIPCWGASMRWRSPAIC